MKMTKFFAAAMTSLLVIGCTQNEDIAPVTDDNVRIKVIVDCAQALPATKVAFDNQVAPQLQWTGAETMALVWGKTGEASEVLSTLTSSGKGVFSGNIEVPAGFVIADLRGFVIPAESALGCGWNSENEAVLNVNIPQEQTQAVSGEPNWLYSPFFFNMSDSLAEGQTEYIFSGLELKSASDLLRLNVYGKHSEMSDGEILKSVTFRNGPVVTLSQELTVADKTRDNGIKVFMSISGNEACEIDQITVATDKAVYVKDINPKTLAANDVNTLVVHQAAFDLSNGFERYPVALEYSSDNGQTWASAIPASFSSLAVKGMMTLENLQAVKTAMDAQESPVDLDLRKTQYESEVFPDVFEGTKDAKYYQLKSILLPSNVNEIKSQAFYYNPGLESIDLDQIVAVGTSAFRYAGLKTLRVGNQMKSLGQYAFSDLYDMTDAYYNAEPGAGTYVMSWSTGITRTHILDLTVTIGPDAELCNYMFYANGNISTVIFEYSGAEDKMIPAARIFDGAWWLQTIICKGTSGVVYMKKSTANSGFAQNAGQKTTDRYIVVPDGCTEKYQKTFETGYYNFTEYLKDFPFTLIEESAYKNLTE